MTGDGDRVEFKMTDATAAKAAWLATQKKNLERAVQYRAVIEECEDKLRAWERRLRAARKDWAAAQRTLREHRKSWRPAWNPVAEE